MLGSLRRRLPITTSTATAAAAGVDVPSTPQRPAVTPVTSAAADVLPPAGWLGSPVPRQQPERLTADRPSLSTPAAHSSMPPAPPTWTPGRCYHPVHIELAGDRYGVLPEPGDCPGHATLLRCPHLNPDGR